MMETKFYFLMSLKTPAGFENYGQYFPGNDRESAYALFDSLLGKKNLNGNELLHIDLMETIDDFPVKIKTVCCTLDELLTNMKLITLECFRIKNLKTYEEK